MTRSKLPEEERGADPAVVGDLPRGIIDDLMEGFQVIDPDYRYLYVNRAVAAHGRTTSEELVGRTMQEAYPGIESTAMFALLSEVLQARVPRQMENEFTFPDGSRGWFELRFEPVPAGVAILSVEITERKAAEAALRRSERALRMLSGCNRTLVRATEEGQFLRDVCALAVDHGYLLAWVGFREDDADGTIRPGAVAGRDDGYLDALHLTWRDDPRGRGPTGRAIRTGEVTVARFIETDPEFSPWRRRALERGFRSSVSLPFRVDGEVAGALNIYASETDAFDGEELRLLEELALDIGHGITTVRDRTAHRLAQEAARASAQRWSATFNAISDVVCVISPSHEFVEMNEAGCTALGLPREEIIGRRCFELVHGTNAPVATCPCTLVGAKLTPATGTIEKGDRHLELLAWPILGPSGALEGFVHIVKDVTARLRMEQTLRENEARFRAVFEVASVGIVQVDPNDGKITRCNQKYQEITGYSEEELQVISFRDLTHPEDRQGDWELFSRASRGDARDYRNEKRYVRKDGSIVWVRLNASFVRDDAGRPVRTVAICEDITERKAAELARLESEERYRTLFENSLDAVLLTMPDGRILSANPSACRMFGRTEEEICALGRDAVVNLEDERLSALLEERAAKGRAFGELTFRRRDGSTFPGEVSSVLFRDRNGDLRSSMIIRDISALKAMLTALRESEERYRLLFEHSPVGIAVHADGKVVFTNQAGAEIVRARSPAEVIGTSIEEIVHPEGLSAAKERVARLLAGERGLYPTEDRYVRRDGTIVPVEVMAVPLTYMGRPAVQVIVTDITERKRSEEALRQSEAKFRTIFEGNASAMAIIERDTSISMVNREYCKVSRYTEGDVVGTSWTKQIPPADLERLKEYNSRRLVDPKSAPDQYEFSFYRKDGAIRDCLMSVGVIPASGQIICSFVDITGRKRAEARRAELEEQLREAQKMEVIGRLAGGVAHDFNNLLSVILSYGEFAVAQLRESDPVRLDIVEIVDAGRRAAGLTRQLLAFGRRQILAPEVLDLNGVVSSLENMLGRLLGEDVEISTFLAAGLGSVRADRGQIEQVIMNLAVNSRDAMPEGGKLTIETANAELDGEYAERHVAIAPGSYVMLSVTDTGCGMDAETRGRVFEPFFTTKGKGKGTGLGLSTVYGIVKQSGGNIWVYSEIGHGTTFKVYLPRIDEPAEKCRDERPSEPVIGSGTVLVVEDEDAVRKLTERILRNAGYRVLTAANGGEALLQCERFPGEIALLLTDVVMPQMSGRELATRLEKASPGLKVLYMSGYTDDAIVHHGALAPGTHFIGKPFSATELTRKISEILTG